MKRGIIFFSFALIFIFSSAIYSQENKIIIKTEAAQDTISRHIYGHFAEHLGRCIYGGIWVGEDSDIPNTRGIRNDVVEALKEIDIPNIRWPGGCFADAYQWKDGIGPRDERPEKINMFWGDVIDDNSFGTHEFLDFCEMINAEPYIAINVGSGTVKDAAEWIEYVTSDKNTEMTKLRKENGREEPWDVKYWGIGNENWGCGGNMDADYYADLYKRFATYCRAPYKIASGGLDHDFNWTETLMKETENLQNLIQGISYHRYTVANDWQTKGDAIDFDEKEWFQTVSKNMAMEENLKGHIAVMEKYDPDNNVALIADEWGNWHDPHPGSNPAFLYQQNTLRDAITASIYLNIFNKFCRRVKMANIAQTVNVLQAMLLTKDEQLVKTPSFYVFKMYKVHHDALMLPVELKSEKYTFGEYSIPALSASASRKGDEINITVANVDPNNAHSTEFTFDVDDEFEVINAEVITSENMNDYNDFESKEKVNIKEFDGYNVENKILTAELPAKSVVLLTLKGK